MPAVIHDRYDDAYLRGILRECKTIAMVGASANWNRPSYFAMKYLLDRGYTVIPVNPAAAGQEILGQKVYGSIAELPQKVDMVDIFRNSEAAGPITDEAIAHGAKVVWMQIAVRNDAAAERAEKAGLRVVMNRCPKIEHSRLAGTIEWHGIASGVISSRKRRL
ncbi:CoA-binding protein [Reyranella sp.]|uniref:CoA-binding protein n=1 Tax=Reyranella sp. TaxID=1929291 RepID=UPI003BAA7B6E